MSWLDDMLYAETPAHSWQEAIGPAEPELARLLDLTARLGTFYRWTWQDRLPSTPASYDLASPIVKMVYDTNSAAPINTTPPFACPIDTSCRYDAHAFVTAMQSPTGAVTNMIYDAGTMRPPTEPKSFCYEPEPKREESMSRAEMLRIIHSVQLEHYLNED